MTSEGIDEQLTSHLTDVHAIELQALEQMRLAPRVAGDRSLAAIFHDHFDETVGHEVLVREQLERRGRVAATWDAAVDVLVRERAGVAG